MARGTFVIANVLRRARELRARLRGGGVRATLARGTGGALAVEITGTGLAFGLHVLLARLMGVDDYGVFTYALSWVMLLAIFGRVGFGTSLIRFVAAYEAQKDWGALRGVLRRGNQIALAASLFMVLVGITVVWGLRGRMSHALFLTLLISPVVLPLTVLSQLRMGALRALRRVVISALPERLFRPIVLSCLALIAYCTRFAPLSGPVVMGLHVGSVAVAFAMGCVFLRSALPGEVPGARPEYRTGEWVAASVSILLVGAEQVVLRRTDVLMVGALLGTTQAGIYAVGVRIATLVWFILQSVNAIAAPMISRLYAKGQRKELQHMLRFAAKVIVWLTLPLAAGLVLLAGVVLSAFGDKFVAGQTALRILCVGQLMSALAGSVVYLMIMSGHHREAARITGGIAVLNIVLNAILIPLLGIAGAAVATAISTAIWKYSLLLLVRRKLGMKPSVFGLVC